MSLTASRIRALNAVFDEGSYSAAARRLGITIANWITALALDCVIVGGGITEALGAPWLAKVRAGITSETEVLRATRDEA